jgi:hypothetical protein
MCVLLNREGRFFDAIKRNYDESCAKFDSLSKEDQARCTIAKRTVDGRLAAQELALGLYSDSIVEAGSIYTREMVAPEVAVKRQQLIARKTSNLGNYIDTYWNHLGKYLNDRKINQSEWLNSCKAVSIN